MVARIDSAPAEWCLPVYEWDHWPGDLLVIVPCSKEKLGHPAPASELYVGSFHRLAMKAARHMVPDDQIRVLSALYGYVEPDRVIAPYEARMCKEGKTSSPVAGDGMDDPTGPPMPPLPTVLAAQVRTQGIEGATDVLSLCPLDYWHCVRRTWGAAAVNALYGCRGIGDQRQVLSAITRMEVEEYRP